MKLPNRFSLSTLLLLMLVVASVFGYAQWRRLSLIKEVNELNAIGDATFEDPPSWRRASRQVLSVVAMPRYRTIDPAIQITAGFWPQVVTEDAEFNVRVLASGQYCIGNEEVSKDDAKAYLQAIQSRLESLGITVRGATVFDIEKGAIRSVRPIDELIPSVTVE